ncbi:MAG: VWA domain-containing protein [Ruminiclostridium sp.]|nr:VWA domain-containing protein [Ruminiclostridium sp.]
MEQQVYTADNGAAPASVNDQHLACVLLLDVSSSMQNNNAIGKLNNAIVAFKEQCLQDDALRRGLDIAIVAFASEVNILQEFTPITEMITPVLEANGQTSMGAGLATAVDMLERRKAQYKEIGIPYHRPWIFMISDGAPNDDYAPAFNRVCELQQNKKLELWAVGVPGYQKEILTALTMRVIELDDNLKFASLFEWLSNSLSTKSRSNPGDIVKYEMLPEGSRVIPSDWGK